VLESLAGAMDSVETKMAGAEASGGVAGVGGTSRHWQHPFVLIGLGLGCRWGDWRRGKPLTSSSGPHLPFIALGDGGPPTM
jgi:hypothetical protein